MVWKFRDRFKLYLSLSKRHPSLASSHCLGTRNGARAQGGQIENPICRFPDLPLSRLMLTHSARLRDDIFAR